MSLSIYFSSKSIENKSTWAGQFTIDGQDARFLFSQTKAGQKLQGVDIMVAGTRLFQVGKTSDCKLG